VDYESRRMKRNGIFLAPRHIFSWGTEDNKREP
jgi:hypothetical protein